MGKGEPLDPLHQDDVAALEAELRRAIQHRDAAQRHAMEAELELQRVMMRAREVLNATRGKRGGADS